MRNLWRHFSGTVAGAANDGALISTSAVSGNRHAVSEVYLSSKSAPSDDRIPFRIYRSIGGASGGVDLLETAFEPKTAPSGTRVVGFPFSTEPFEAGDVLTSSMLCSLSFQWSAEPGCELWSRAISGGGFTVGIGSNPLGKVLNATLKWFE